MYINPKYIMVEFLRNRLTDPRSSRRPSANSNSLTATAGQTEFDITCSSGTSLSHISSVEVNSTAQEKWEDYYIDSQNEKIIFYSGLSVGDSVDINFYEGTTNWIYWDKPVKTLGETSFPRISVLVVSSQGSRLGNYEAPMESIINFQIDVWTKEKAANQIFTIDGIKYTGEALAEYLAYKITEVLEDYESDMFPALYDYTLPQAPKTLPFDEVYQAHHQIVEPEMKGISVGRIS